MYEGGTLNGNSYQIGLSWTLFVTVFSVVTEDGSQQHLKPRMVNLVQNYQKIDSK